MTEPTAAPVQHRHLPPLPIRYVEVVRPDQEATPPPNVHQAMAACMHDVKAVGKTGVNEQQGYRFRSIDAFMDALNPAMAANGLHVVPMVLQRIVGERTTRNGAFMRMVDLEVAFSIYGPAGDSVVVVAWGEGTDTVDKATNKAMTGAFKYAIVQAFMVPTTDIQDTDQGGSEPPAPRQQAQGAPMDQLRQRVAAELRDQMVAAATVDNHREALLGAWQRAKADGLLGVEVAVPSGWVGVQADDWPEAVPEQVSLGQLVTVAKYAVQHDIDSGERPPEAEPAPEQCAAERKADGARCTRDAGHKGAHAYPAAQPDTCGAKDAQGWPCIKAPGHQGDHSSTEA